MTSEGADPYASKNGWGLVLLLGVAAWLRAVAWQKTAVLFNDGPVFLGMAEGILAGRWDEILAHPYHPLYPALIALVSLGGADLETAAVAVSIGGGLLSVLAIFLFAYRGFGREVAWLSAWTVALHPWAVDFSSDVMSDGLYAGLYLLGFSFLASYLDRPKTGAALGCGLAAGLAYLTRPEGVGLLIVAGVLFVARAVAKREDRIELLRAFLVLGLAAAFVMAPLVFFMAKQSGEVGLTTKKSLSGLARGDASTDLAPIDLAWEQRQRVAEEGVLLTPLPLPLSSERAAGGGAIKPPRTIWGFLEACSRALRTSLAALRYEIAVMVIFGVWVMRGRFRRWRETTVAVPVVLYSGLLILLVWGAGYVARRHALAALLPLVAYAAIGWRAAYTAFIEVLPWPRSDLRQHLLATRGLCVGLVLVLGLAWGARDMRPRREERIAVRTAAEWLRENREIQSRVAAQKLRVAYYAGAEYSPLPSGNFGPIEASLRAQGVNWVIIDENGIEDHRGLAEGVGTWLDPVHSFERLGRRAWVFQIHPRP